MYRVRVSVGGSCTPGETVYVRDLLQAGPAYDMTNLGEVPCGSEFLLKNMQTGSYVMQARNAKFGSNGEIAAAANVFGALVTFDVGESNRNLALSMAHGVSVEGRVVAAQGSAPLPLDKIKVRSAGSPGILILENTAPARAVDAEGRFRWDNLAPGPRGLLVDGLGTEFYIKQVRLRGIPIRGWLMDFPSDGTVEIEIDSQPAGIHGSVRNGDKPVANADVALLSWPLMEGSDPDDRTLVRHLTADAEGNFQAAGLAPGEYRIFAVTRSDLEQSQLPAVWTRLATTAEKVTLTRGGISEVTLKVTDPSR